jgi:hypothetical protein
MKRLLEEAAGSLERLSLDLERWNREIEAGGWGTVQVEFNRRASGECAVLALRIREELAKAPKP